MFSGLVESFSNREFWTYAAWLDITTRYRTSKIGVAWLVINPLVFVFVLGFIYSQFLGTSVDRFLPHLAIGYTFWRMIIHILTESSQCLRSSKPFIMEGRINMMDFVLRVLSKAVFNFTFGLIVIILTLVIFRGLETVWIMTMLVTVPIVFWNLIWIAAIVAVFSARYPSTTDFINTILLLGFLLTPIMWEASFLPADTTVGTVVRINPAFHLIEFVRQPIFGAMPEFTTLVYVAAMSVFGSLAADLYCRRNVRYVPLWL